MASIITNNRPDATCAICLGGFYPGELQYTHVNGVEHDGFHHDCLSELFEKAVEQNKVPLCPHDRVPLEESRAKKMIRPVMTRFKAAIKDAAYTTLFSLPMAAAGAAVGLAAGAAAGAGIEASAIVGAGSALVIIPFLAHERLQNLGRNLGLTRMEKIITAMIVGGSFGSRFLPIFSISGLIAIPTIAFAPGVIAGALSLIGC